MKSKIRNLTKFWVIFNVVLMIVPFNKTLAVDVSIYDAQSNCVTTGNGSGNGKGGAEDGDKLEDEIKQNIKDIYAYANGKFGLSGESIAGILGNWKMESNIQPYAVEGDFAMSTGRSIETAKANTNGLMGIGFGQWTAGRHTSLVNWAKEHHGGVWWTTEAQLDYMFHGDGGFVAILKSYALNSTDDILNNTVLFHNTWEISADSAEQVINARGGATKEIWSYMQSEGMTGKKDESKINKIEGESSGGESSSNAGGAVEDICANEEGSNGGSMGQSTKVNGKTGKILEMMSYEDALEKYKGVITLPKFKANEYDWSKSPFKVTVDQGDLRGQCTELTWAYMGELYDGRQPTMGNGGYIWESYKGQGANIVKEPTVGYGFSALDGYLGASGSAGHTGVVIAVFEDGSFLTANFNFPPHSAPERVVTVSLVDGVDGTDNVHFFSGIGESKISKKN